jgi:hypothetical protein
VYAKTVRHKNTNQNQTHSIWSIVFVFIIWLASFLISSPLFFFTEIENSSMEINLSNNEEGEEMNLTIQSYFNSSFDDQTLNKSNSFGYLIYCVEKWPHTHSRIIFSSISLLIQYILPILIVGVAYGQIWWKLKRHRKKLRAYTTTVTETVETNKLSELTKRNSKQFHSSTKRKTKTDDIRQHKMNVLLAFIAFIFAASWLPLNIFNILSDSKSGFMKPNYVFYLINTICILFAMSSAVSNPFLYGFLNENFKREYVKLFNRLKTKCIKNENIEIAL